MLRELYARVVVPYDVAAEIRAGGNSAFGLNVFEKASWLDIRQSPVVLPPYLQSSLDRGAAAVIQTALQEGIELVCIDEVAGRRVAKRFCGRFIRQEDGFILFPCGALRQD